MANRDVHCIFGKQNIFRCYLQAFLSHSSEIIDEARQLDMLRVVHGAEYSTAQTNGPKIGVAGTHFSSKGVYTNLRSLEFLTAFKKAHK